MNLGGAIKAKVRETQRLPSVLLVAATLYVSGLLFAIPPVEIWKYLVLAIVWDGLHFVLANGWSATGFGR